MDQLPIELLKLIAEFACIPVNYPALTLVSQELYETIRKHKDDVADQILTNRYERWKTTYWEPGMTDPSVAYNRICRFATITHGVTRYLVYHRTFPHIVHSVFYWGQKVFSATEMSFDHRNYKSTPNSLTIVDSDRKFTITPSQWEYEDKFGTYISTNHFEIKIDH